VVRGFGGGSSSSLRAKPTRPASLLGERNSRGGRGDLCSTPRSARSPGVLGGTSRPSSEGTQPGTRFQVARRALRVTSETEENKVTDVQPDRTFPGLTAGDSVESSAAVVHMHHERREAERRSTISRGPGTCSFRAAKAPSTRSHDKIEGALKDGAKEVGRRSRPSRRGRQGLQEGADAPHPQPLERRTTEGVAQRRRRRMRRGEENEPTEHFDDAYAPEPRKGRASARARNEVWPGTRGAR